MKAFQLLYSLLLSTSFILLLSACNGSDQSNDDKTPEEKLFVFSSPSVLSVQENTNVPFFSPSLVSNQGIKFSLTGGADQAAFIFDSSRRELSFSSAPDFENPHDSNHDNVYEVEISAWNKSNDSIKLALEVHVSDQARIVADFTYPIENTNFGGITQTIIARGTLRDIEDEEVKPGDFDEVLVNNVKATIKGDNHNQWEAEIPINIGIFQVELFIKKDSEMWAKKIRVSNDKLRYPMTEIEIDKHNNRIIGTNYNLDAIVSFDLESKAYKVISSRDVGSGPDFSSLVDLTLESSDTAYAVDRLSQLFKVDLNTGTRTLLPLLGDDPIYSGRRIRTIFYYDGLKVSGLSNSSIYDYQGSSTHSLPYAFGTSLAGVSAVDVSSDGNELVFASPSRLFTYDPILRSLYTIPRVVNEASPVSLNSINGVANFSEDKILIAHRGELDDGTGSQNIGHNITLVDKKSGETSLFASNLETDKVPFLSLRDIETDLNNGKAYVTDTRQNALIEIDLKTLERRKILETSVAKKSISGAIVSALSEDKNSIVYYDLYRKVIESINLTTHQKETILDFSRYDNNALINGAKILTFDLEANTVYVVSNTNSIFGDLIKINLSDGSFDIVSDSAKEEVKEAALENSGASITSLSAHIHDKNNKEMIFWKYSNNLGTYQVKINLETGAREKIETTLPQEDSERNFQRRPLFAFASTSDNEVFLTTRISDPFLNERAVLQRANTTTGIRTTLAEGGDFSLPTHFSIQIYSLTWNQDKSALLAAVPFDGAILEINPNTGITRLISGRGKGNGPHLNFPRAIHPIWEDNKLFVMDTGIDALVKIDLVSGDRTIFSY